MAILDRRISDGISVATRRTISLGKQDPEALKADLSALREMLARATPNFEAAIGAAESYWRAQSSNAEGESTEPLTFAWYRDRILADIDLLRTLLAREATDREFLVVLALSLGSTVEEALWRFAQGPNIRRGVKARARTRAGGKTRGSDQSKASAEREREIQRMATAYMKDHPGHSHQSMAAWIGRKLTLAPATVKRHLRKTRISS
ncbi:MAG: hypothetical protein ABI051_00425 [Vicinamibacterales bacterium]